MPQAKKSRGEDSPARRNSILISPQTSLHRASSGLSSLLPRIPFGQRASISRLNERLVPDPYPGDVVNAYEFIAEGPQITPQQSRAPQVDIPTSYEIDASDCPNNQERLHSFPGIEPSRSCSYCCGLIVSTKILKRNTSDFRPLCEACQTRGSNSHLRAQRDSGPRRSSQSNSRRRRDSSSSADQPVRLLSSEEAARRRARPMRASVPAHLLPRVQDPVVLDITSTPQSPRLHHVHGLPDSENYPFVHRREVEQHFAALRGGSPSPLREIAELARRQTYNAPVFYPGPRSSVTPRHAVPGSATPSSPSPPPSPPSTTQRTRKKEGRRALRTNGVNPYEDELENTRVYQRHAALPRQRSPLHNEIRRTPSPSDSSDSDSDSDSTIRVGGRRVELRGGCGYANPRLRGGCGDHPAKGKKRFKVKKWLLTGSCLQRACYIDRDSDNDLPPVRIATPAEAIRARQNKGKTARLPSHIAQRISPATSSGPSSQVPANNTPSISSPNHRASAPTTVESPPISSLRGGAGSESTLLDTHCLPVTLFWLAGGMGNPITVRSWKKSRPKVREATWLGLVAFGRRAGTAYVDDDAVGEGEEESVTGEGTEKEIDRKKAGGKREASKKEEASKEEASKGEAPKEETA